MRVLVVTHYYSTHGGGIEIVAGALARVLAASHQVTWVASDCDPIPSGLERLVTFVPMRSANTIERLTGLPFPLWGPGSLIRLWRVSRDVDVIHLHDFAYLGNWFAFVFGGMRRQPVCITQHVGFIPYRSAALRLILRMMHATIGRVMLGRAAQVIFVSKVVQRYFEAIVTFRRPTRVIANGVDTEIFTATGSDGMAAARAELNLDPSRPVLLFVGRFVEKKGLHILEALVRCFPEVSWLFAGWGALNPGRWNAPNVRVLEGRGGATLRPLYRAADLLVLPSIGEGLPLVVQESMSCGTPVIVGEDTAEAIDAPKDLVFTCAVGGAETAAAWEREIRRILNDREGLSRVRPSVAEFARGRWSWPTCAAHYSAVYDDLLVRAGRRG